MSGLDQPGRVRASWIGGIGEICLDRPSKRNALDQSMLAQLGQAAQQLAQVHQLRAVVVRGAGPVFCAGADLRAFNDLQTVEQREHWRSLGRSTFALLGEIGVPVIAVVQGGAFGGGVELALHCQVRIAGLDAVFCMPEFSLGWEPEWGGMQMLPALIGSEAADEILRSGRRVTAREAVELGLVSRAVSDPMSCARTFAAGLAGKNEP